jgi:hypothetical protein
VQGAGVEPDGNDIRELVGVSPVQGTGEDAQTVVQAGHIGGLGGDPGRGLGGRLGLGKATAMAAVLLLPASLTVQAGH